ncbi:hypothetical protein A3D68_01310 [Candidatus Adlerbacteria bacterium RIFCSPHIGHO2_02_FULL_52_17]|uniref:Transglycosylase SLT domain-containing protein n=1 Tax=Candidatus Adlerbacteria bacterium RIFCSPHIGHO2_02_FULL_52_17 TaxID=1797240 RepID=A0A1F4XMR0_9BACT|nr:MAG: hypothetical protein A3D68_01310 [Candidatus Adlerbacteria bacterium RIFCSPHIGHO2_02_FULL_52_17]
MNRWFVWLMSGVFFLLVYTPVYAAELSFPSCSIKANPSTIAPGGSTKLVWNSVNAASETISTLGNVATSGARTVNPNTTTIYNGTFAGSLGTTTCSAKVTVAYAQNNYIYPGSSGYLVENPPTPSGGGGNNSLSETQSNPTPIYSPQLNRSSQSGIPSGGLVTCTGINCNLCDFGQLIQNIINFLIGLSIPIAVVMFAWAGILYFTSAGNKTNVTRAKGIFKTVFIGFILALTGWLVVQTVLSVLVKQDFYIGNHWNSLECEANESRPGVTRPITVGEWLGTLPALQSYNSTISSSQSIVNVDPCSTTGGIYNGGMCEGPNGSYCPSGYTQGSSGCVSSSSGSLGSTVPVYVGAVNNPQMASYIATACAQYGNCALAQAIAQAESSGGINCTTSPTGAVGCMQVLSRTACSINPSVSSGCGSCLSSGNSTSAACSPVAQTISNPTINTNLGVQYISQLQKQFGTCQLTAAAYYSGPGTVKKSGVVPWARSYVSKVCGT